LPHFFITTKYLPWHMKGSSTPPPCYTHTHTHTHEVNAV
jgi:hypothetical protein